MSSKNSKDGKSGGFDLPKDGLMTMIKSFSVLRLTSLVGMANISFTKEELLEMNRQLNNIRKPKRLR